MEDQGCQLLIFTCMCTLMHAQVTVVHTYTGTQNRVGVGGEKERGNKENMRKRNLSSFDKD